MAGSDRYGLWLGFVAGQRPKRHRAFLEEFDGSAEAVFRAAVTGDLVAHTPADEKLLFIMREKASEWYIDRCLKYLQGGGITPVLEQDEGYPALLREIYLPPPVIYVKGSLPPSISLPIAVIGSRDCTDYGRDVAKKLAGELCSAGACIVSGMAYGIDKAAAQAALKCEASDFPTIAVLGSGIDVVYPAENRKLYEEICERGAVISEFLPGTKPETFNFPRRNRVISGISRGVVVAEAAIKSGTRITVDYALEQGRDVFAVPGRITDAACEGSNLMIREGMAKPVFCVEDILEEYGVKPEAQKRANEIDESALSHEEKLIVRLLRAGERTVDELCELTGLDVARLNSTLTAMEISGIIKQSSGRMYGL